MKCQGRGEIGELRDLGLGLLMATLSEVTNAQIGKLPHQCRRMELRHDDRRDLRRVPAGIACRLRHLGGDRGQACLEVGHRYLRKSGMSRSPSSSSKLRSMGAVTRARFRGAHRFIGRGHDRRGRLGHYVVRAAGIPCLGGRLAAIEARRDHGDANLVAEGVVDHRAEDDVRLGMHGLLHQARGIVDLEDAQVGTALDRQQHFPCAPSMDASSSGDATASSAALMARSAPLADPMPMSAEPAPCMTDFTSAKSRLISPGVVMRSVMPCTPASSTWSAVAKASSMPSLPRSLISRSRSFGTTMRVSTSFLRLATPTSAWAERRFPSNPKGLRDDTDCERPDRLRDASHDGRATGARFRRPLRR